MEPSSSRFSVVPGFIRNRMRDKKRREQEKALEEARRTEEPSESRYSDEDRKALSEMAGEGFAEGGMVTKGKKDRGDSAPLYNNNKLYLQKTRGERMANEDKLAVERKYEQDIGRAARTDEAPQPEEYAKGGLVKKYAKGGMVTKSKSKSAGSKHRGDGICMKGHTKGKMY